MYTDKRKLKTSVVIRAICEQRNISHRLRRCTQIRKLKTSVVIRAICEQKNYLSQITQISTENEKYFKHLCGSVPSVSKKNLSEIKQMSTKKVS
jgi:hypothetical protein